ncbi:MAG TPA: NAD(P)/FAD-dependent oxidoreductase [Dehalococcoidia bacterium]|nr:NAD(P)/FAD-dependent oxidoreductase [Dehalococcoidia bacterium]
MDDVIVVGAGPAGNYAALGLANRGYSVTVIDWRQNIGDKPCTGIVGQECLSRFPIDPALVYRRASSANVVSPEDLSLRLDARSPQASIIDRVSYVASFAERAQSAGARYLLGQRVLQIVPEAGWVSVSTEDRTCRSRSMVLAAGFGSPLARQLGLGSVPDHVSGVQALVATNNIQDVEIYLGQNVAPGFFSWVVPTSPGHALVGLLTRRRAPAHLAKFLQLLRHAGKITEVLKEPECWGIPLRPLKRTYRDRMLVVGDAAGQVKPTTGGGIYYSLLASEIAVEVLGRSLLADDLSAAALSEYQARWKNLLNYELEAGYSARRLFEFLTDQQINSLIRQVTSNGLHQELINSSESSFDWHSQVIGKIMRNPAVSGMLRLVNPLLAKFAPASDLPLALAAANSSHVDPSARAAL